MMSVIYAVMSWWCHAEFTGTVEFIMDAVDQTFYFMEMNTRLQVSGWPAPYPNYSYQTPHTHMFTPSHPHIHTPSHTGGTSHHWNDHWQGSCGVADQSSRWSLPARQPIRFDPHGACIWGQNIRWETRVPEWGYSVSESSLQASQLFLLLDRQVVSSWLLPVVFLFQ